MKRKEEILPLLEAFSKEKNLEYRIPMPEVLDYCVLEYPFALWQWGTSVSVIPSLHSDTPTLFKHLMDISSPDYLRRTNRIFLSLFRPPVNWVITDMTRSRSVNT